VLVRALALATRLLAATWRVEQPPWPVEGPCVVVFWHGEQLPMIALHRGLGLVGIASRSRDGGIVAGVLSRLGYPVLRGSTSRGGLDVLRAAIGAIREGGRPAFAVDGPRGPAGTVHPGAEAIARRGGVPVVYGVVHAAGYHARSWDRFFVPWPFARVAVRYGVWRAGEGRTLEEAMRALGINGSSAG
jgi:hypothetical protein